MTGQGGGQASSRDSEGLAAGARSVPRSERRSIGLLGRCWLIFVKDLRLEWRTREVVYSSAFLALIIAVVFGFGVLEQELRSSLLSVALWVALLFSGTLALQRAFEREREGRCLQALLLMGPIAWPLYLAKVASNFLFLSLVLAFAAPLTMLSLGVSAPAEPLGLALSLLLGAGAYATVGTLVSAMLGELRLRTLLLPVLLFPLMIPIFALGVTASTSFVEQGKAQMVELRAQPGATAIVMQLNGHRLEVASGVDQSWHEFRLQVEAAAAAGEFEPLGVLGGEHSLVLVAEPGEALDIDVQGLQLDWSRSQSDGWRFLLILLLLDGLLVGLCGWLFGVLLEAR